MGSRRIHSSLSESALYCVDQPAASISSSGSPGLSPWSVCSIQLTPLPYLRDVRQTALRRRRTQDGVGVTVTVCMQDESAEMSTGSWTGIARLGRVFCHQWV